VLVCVRRYPESFRGSEWSLSSFGVATLAGLWSFDGWNNLNLVTEELKDPSHNLPRAVLLGTSFTMAA
jgi:L-type amino acid transporter 9